jgi:hypothetical protein
MTMTTTAFNIRLNHNGPLPGHRGEGKILREGLKGTPAPVLRTASFADKAEKEK